MPSLADLGQPQPPVDGASGAGCVCLAGLFAACRLPSFCSYLAVLSASQAAEAYLDKDQPREEAQGEEPPEQGEVAGDLPHR